MNITVQSTPLPIQFPSHQQAWEFVIGELRAEISRGDFDTWVKPIVPISYRNRVYTIGFFSKWALDWTEGHLRSRINQLLRGVYNENVQLEMKVIDGFYTAEEISTKQAPPEAIAPPVSTPPAAPSTPDPAPSSGQTRVEASPRKVMLQRAYGSERARLIQPEHGMFITHYFFFNWLPLLGHSAVATIMAARSMCYWNPMTGELRNTLETEISELAQRASVSVRTIKDVLANELVQRYFLHYKVRRRMTPEGIRTAGIYLQVRMDDPLTPDDQANNNLPEDEHWYTEHFEGEEKDERD